MLFLFAALTSNAQIEKGKIQASGNFSITNIDNGNSEITIFNLTPQAGLFLNDHMSLGLVLGYQSSGNSTAKQKTFNYGLFSRFFKPIADKFYFFAQPQIIFGSGETGSGEDISSFNIGIRPGLSYFPSNRISMDLSVQGLAFDQYESGNIEQSTTSFSFSPSNVSLGVSFLF